MWSRKLLLNLIIFINSISVITPQSNKLVHREKRIVNGEDAPQGLLPYMASFYRLSQLSNEDGIDRIAPSPYCGGAAVTDTNNFTYIVTAGHCVSNKFPHKVRIVFDLYTVDDKLTSEVATVAHEPEAFILHPAYDDHPKQPNADIAVVLLKDPLAINSNRTLQLPGPNYTIQFAENLIVSGWGRLSRSGPQAKNLQVLRGLSRDATCTWLHGDNFLSDHICLRDLNGTRHRWTDICRGDSGGPLVDTNSDASDNVTATNDNVLVGLVSFGTCLGIPASVFTRVKVYTEWIERVVGDYHVI